MPPRALVGGVARLGRLAAPPYGGALPSPPLTRGAAVINEGAAGE